MGITILTNIKMPGKKAVKAKTSQRKAGKLSQGKNRKKPVRLEKQVGLSFPCSRVTRHCRKAKVAKRISKRTGVFASAVMEYIAAEVLELAGNACKEKKKLTIFPKHLQTAIRSDEELNYFLKTVTIRSAHVLPHIEDALLPKNKKKVSQ